MKCGDDILMAYTKEVLTLAIEVGDAMLRNGAEIYRVQDTITHILKAYDIKEFDVYVLSNGIFASANEDKDDACSMIRHVPSNTVNLAKISSLNQLARDICTHQCSLGDSWIRLDECKNIPLYPKKMIILFAGIGTAGFCYLFGGNILDCLFTFCIGMLEQALLFFFSIHKMSNVLSNVFSSLFVTLLSILIMITGLPVLQDKIVIGSIMLLVPGMAFTTAIRDYYNRDYLSGTIHLIDALVTAFCIAVGVFIGILLCSYLGGGNLHI